MKVITAKISLLFLIFFLSCIGSNKLYQNNLTSVGNKVFLFESNMRIINFVFDSSECRLSFFYKCDSLIEKYRRVNINCDYEQVNDSMIVIKNKLYNSEQHAIDLTPPKEELEKCMSLYLANNQNKKIVSPWNNDDGFIPQIDIDTIKVFSKNEKLFLHLSKRRGQDIYNFLWKEKK